MKGPTKTIDTKSSKNIMEATQKKEVQTIHYKHVDNYSNTKTKIRRGDDRRLLF